MSDIKFIVEGRPFHAHRIALLSSSEIFKTMFEGVVAAAAALQALAQPSLRLGFQGM